MRITVEIFWRVCGDILESLWRKSKQISEEFPR
jgi:hypothetical protein